MIFALLGQVLTGNMTQDKLDSLQFLWKKMGKPSFKDSRYYNFKFYSLNDYFDELKKFYGTNDIKQHILDNANEVIQNNLVCNNQMRAVDIDIPFDNTSAMVTNMMGMYEGFAGVFTMTYEATDDPDFECPYDDEYGDCFDYECLLPVTRKVDSMIRDKYGIRTNTKIHEIN